MTARRDTMHIHLRPLALALALIPVAGSGAPDPEAATRRLVAAMEAARSDIAL
jgi:hypothetical protein